MDAYSVLDLASVCAERRRLPALPALPAEGHHRRPRASNVRPEDAAIGAVGIALLRMESHR